MKFLHISFLFISLSLWGDELLIIKSGYLEGILAAKGDAWIEVKEGNRLAERYLAPWHGGSPARGGGFDLKMLQVFQDLIVGNRVYLDWFWDGHLRARKVKHIKPFKRSGIFNGTLIGKGDKWIDVKNEDSQILWRFYAKWLGGLPDEGGGYHPKTLEFFDNFELSDPVRFKWSYDYRPRIDRFIEQEDDDVFVPFYEGKTIPIGSTQFQPASPVRNPFDQVDPASGTNPFDQLPARNPFDQIVPASTNNPFDQLPKPTPINPFEASPNSGVNPFDSTSPKAGNPFEGVDKQKGNTQPSEKNNPFDNAPKPKDGEVNPFDNVPLPGNPFDVVPTP